MGMPAARRIEGLLSKQRGQRRTSFLNVIRIPKGLKVIQFGLSRPKGLIERNGGPGLLLRVRTLTGILEGAPPLLVSQRGNTWEGGR
jgi:hypothetical protein